MADTIDKPALLAFLKERLSEADLANVAKLLNGGEPEAPAAAMDAKLRAARVARHATGSSGLAARFPNTNRLG